MTAVTEKLFQDAIADDQSEEPRLQRPERPAGNPDV